MQRLVIVFVCSVFFLGCKFSRDEEPLLTGKNIVNLGSGTVNLPNGFTHSHGQGIDSTVGHFTSGDGHLVINYDIGLMAGVYASNMEGKEILSSSKVTAHGLKAIIVVSRWKNATHAIVSFPKGGPANFFAAIRNDTDLEAVTNLALSYRLNQ